MFLQRVLRLREPAFRSARDASSCSFPCIRPIASNEPSSRRTAPSVTCPSYGRKFVAALLIVNSVRCFARTVRERISCRSLPLTCIKAHEFGKEPSPKDTEHVVIMAQDEAEKDCRYRQNSECHKTRAPR